MRLIDSEPLYQRLTEIAGEAVAMLNKAARDHDIIGYVVWSAILAEISAFKSAVEDSPTVDAIPVSFLEGLRDNARSVEASDRIQEIINLWDEELKGWS